VNTPLGTTEAICWLVVFSALFAAAGILYARRHNEDLDAFVTARNTQGPIATLATLLASALGAWILLSPAESATWGGMSAVIGYALGSMSPLVAMLVLGRRMRELMPHGHSLTEYLIARYGRPLYGLTLAIMVFYVFIELTAEITAISMLMTLLAPVPMGLTAVIVMGTVLLYTAVGGLQASIFTDKVQIIIIVPLLLALVAVGWHITGGPGPVSERLMQKAPHLLYLGDPAGLKAGATFFVAILLTGIFHQGSWQRVYAARSVADMQRGFLLGGLLVVPFIFLMGMFGLAWVALEPGGEASVALFAVVIPRVVPWVALAFIPLGLSLVMSSADTAISAIGSIIAVDGARLMPQASQARLLRLSRGLVLLLAIPVMIVAAQGFSVLYLFLLADLLCAAAAFPVFFGLWSRRHDGVDALLGTLAGLAAGLMMFPRPDQPMDTLLESFLLAALVPVAVTGVLRLVRRNRTEFRLESLDDSVQRF